MFSSLQLIFFISSISIQLISASYLDTPRIYFSGNFRADVSSVNNIDCNFDPDLEYNSDANKDFNAIGTGEFSFLNTEVYGAVGRDGRPAENDPVIGTKVFDNGKRPFAKLVDLDVDVQLIFATVYGMKFGIGWDQTEEGRENLAFKGYWTRNVIAENRWTKVKCYNQILSSQVTPPLGASATTTITDISWNPENDRNSTVLKDLREASMANNNTLQVSTSVYFYTRHYVPFIPFNFTLGHIVGTIGIYQEGEPLNYGGERQLGPNDIPHVDNSVCGEDDLSGFQSSPWWMFKAPFKVHEDSSTVTVDLSNSLPLTNNSDMYDIGPLFLAINQSDCVELINDGSIPYLSDNWIQKTGGVVDYKLSGKQLDTLTSSTTLVVVRQQTTSESHAYPECDTDNEYKYKVFLNEARYYIRPTGFPRAQLEYNETVEIPFYVTHLGKPAENVTVNIMAISHNDEGKVLPENGVTVEDSDNATKVTNSSGLVTFTYRVAKKMREERKYTETPCFGNQLSSNLTTLPIDGQAYRFNYSVCTTQAISTCIYQDDTIGIKGLSSNTASEPYIWETDIYPIFRQFYHLYPVMRGILNLSDYDSVTAYHNLNLLIHAMSLDFNDPNYMPVTRDLSPSKQQMILTWLENELNEYEYDRYYGDSFLNFDSTGFVNVYDHSPEVVPFPNCTNQSVTIVERNYPFCVAETISFITGNNPCDHFDHILVSLNNSDSAPVCTRPLHGYSKDSPNQNICTTASLQEQLQQAIEIEFATIPLYLTTLYSIADGCNVEIYHLLCSVVMQEMLHMVQAANILIATGGRPIIDNSSSVPSYPTKGLPGCVLPGLEIYLDKLNISYIHYVFTAIEAPNVTCIGQPFPILLNNTIGQFYNEISDCINFLGNATFENGTQNLQVKWPWQLLENNTLGQVHIVSNVETAIDGINEIIEQGEGTSPLDPDDIESGQLAHYYRFQEIVCGKKLVKVGNNYTYSGDIIPYDPIGVWPMRQNPSPEGINSSTNCYTEAMAFHKVYRALLRELQATFDGDSENIIKVVELMEALQVHAKRVMRVTYDSNKEETCGPVWNYHFEEEVQVVTETPEGDGTSNQVWYYYVAGSVVLALLVILLLSAILCGYCFVKQCMKNNSKTTRRDKIPFETLQTDEPAEHMTEEATTEM